MDYQLAIKRLKEDNARQFRRLARMKDDREAWAYFDDTANDSATYGGSPGRVVDAFDELIDKTESIIERNNRQIRAYEDFLAGRIDEVEP